jgi:bacterioferritin-associated ferredoxin
MSLNGLSRLGSWLGAGLLFAGVIATQPGCNDDCSSEIEAARAFLDAHRECQMDSDCVAANTGCHTFKNGLCGQSPLNREAAESAEWQRLSRDLGECQSECAQCLAALVPTCMNGLCGGPP